MPKEPQPKRNVYVGGLEDQVNEEILHAAFVPFGDIVEVRTDVTMLRSVLATYYYVYSSTACILLSHTYAVPGTWLVHAINTTAPESRETTYTTYSTARL